MNIYVAKDADLLGNVICEEDVNIWYHSTLRADTESIIIKAGSNVQDNCVLHVDPGYPVMLEKNVTIGHGAILHGCTIDENSVIGMGSIILNGAHIGKNCIIGAGSLITQNKVIPDNSIAFGNPCKVMKEVSEDDIKNNTLNATLYVKEAKSQLEEITL